MCERLEVFRGVDVEQFYAAHAAEFTRPALIRISQVAINGFVRPDAEEQADLAFGQGQAVQFAQAPLVAPSLLRMYGLRSATIFAVPRAFVDLARQDRGGHVLETHLAHLLPGIARRTHIFGFYDLRALMRSATSRKSMLLP